MTNLLRPDHGSPIKPVGHRRYDLLLATILHAVRENKSREDLITLCLDGLSNISTATSIAVIELDQQTGQGGDLRLVGYDQRKVQTDRWRRFCELHASGIGKTSVLNRVIAEGVEVDGWFCEYFPEEFADLRTLFDLRKGGWLLGIQLPRATARHNFRGLFLWYGTGRSVETVPHGADQDWRFLQIFRHCYDMAGFNIRKAARTIIMQRQELLRMLTPSILAHEVRIRVQQFYDNLVYLQQDLTKLLREDKQATLADVTQLLDDMDGTLNQILLPTADKLRDVTHSVMGLTRRIATGPCNPKEEINSALRLLDIKARQTGITVLPVIAPESPVEIQTDPALVMHVIVNLLSNAIESLAEVHAVSSETSRQIQVTLRFDQDRSCKLPVCIDVSDNGPGVPPEHSERIFEAGITQKPGGHGLGLAICRTIAGYLGGSISLENLKGPTIFRFRLPKESTKIADLEEELKAETERS